MKDPIPAGYPGLLEISPPEGSELRVEFLQAAGVEPSKLVQLSPRCWCYMGDFRPSVAIRLNAGLVVKGQCRLAGGSVLSGDVKARRGLFVGPSSVCDGSLVAGGDLCLGHGCRFSGVIHAEGSLLLSSGTRGVLRKDLVAVYASQDLCVERNVAINGKLASGSKVVVIGPTQAKLWRREHCGQEV
jgi:cytoskeletal protein CcmA (bactofilin family)